MATASDFSIKVVIGADDQATAIVSRIAGKTKKELSQLGKLTKSFKGLSLTAMGLGTAGIGAAFAGIMAPAMEVEDALASVQTVAAGTFGSIKLDTQRVEAAARGWSKEHTDTAASFVKSSYQMISAGLDTKQAIEGTRVALAVAKATMGDSVSTASALATVYNTLGDKSADVGAEMNRIGDVLVRTQQYFQLSNMDQLTEGMKYAIPTAIQFKMSLEQTAAVVGQLNTLGLQGGQAGTSFAASMAKMNEASKKLGFGMVRAKDGSVDFLGTIENMRKKFGDKLNLPQTQIALQKAFGQEGLRAVSLLLAKTDDLRKGINEVENAAGAMGKAQTIMESTVSASWQKVKNQMTDIALIAAQDMTPAIMGAVPKITKAINTIREHWENVASVIKTIATVLLMTVLPAAFAKMATAVWANPQFTALVVTIGAIVAGLEAIDAWQKSSQNKKMRQKEGVDGVFRNPGDMAKWQEEQEKRAANRSRTDLPAPGAPGSPAMGAEMPVPGAPGSAQVGGEITIRLPEAPPGTVVERIASDNKAVPIKADLGKSRMGRGAP